MPTVLFEDGSQRPLTATELAGFMTGHPAWVTSRVMELVDLLPLDPIPMGEVGTRLSQLMANAIRGMLPSLVERRNPLMATYQALRDAYPSGFPHPVLFHFVPAPPEMVTEAPEELLLQSATKTFSSFESISAAESQGHLELANQAYIEIASRSYNIALPPDGPARKRAVDDGLRLFNTLAEAARMFVTMQVGPQPQHLPAPPGDLPQTIQASLEAFVKQMRPVDVWNLPVLELWANLLNFGSSPKEYPSIASLEESYGDALRRLNDTGEDWRKTLIQQRTIAGGGW